MGEVSEVKECIGNVLDAINESTGGMDSNDRAAALLTVREFITCAVQLDILDTLRPRKSHDADADAIRAILEEYGEEIWNECCRLGGTWRDCGCEGITDLFVEKLVEKVLR